jgi:signal transduction histidine kinase
MSALPPADADLVIGLLDSDGSADHDQPYRFGVRPRAIARCPFDTQQFARLLLLRGRVRDHVNAAVLDEHARIARELHDSVSQTLYAISITAERAALRHLNQGDAQQMQQMLSDVARLAHSGQSEVRLVLANLWSEQLVSGGLAAGLTRLAAGHTLDIRLSLAAESDPPASTTEALLLIAREALHNIVKHSGANRVDIVLETRADRLTLVVSDNGRGFDPDVWRNGHFGLQSMRKRATAVGAVLALESAEGAGTQVRVSVPRA